MKTIGRNENVHRWTSEQLKELKENYPYYTEHKKEAENKFQKRWNLISAKAQQLKITSMKINKKCAQFLGCCVAERILSHVFKDVERMPYGNMGYDFICNKGKKIDSKSSCLHKVGNYYKFGINYNKTTDYFLLIGFDNRDDLNPKHIWLIKSDEIIRRKMINKFITLTIQNTKYGLSQFLKYELTDKLKETIECCNNLKGDKINENIL